LLYPLSYRGAASRILRLLRLDLNLHALVAGVGAAAAQIAVANPDAPAVHVAQHGAFAHRLLVADDHAFLVAPRRVLDDLLELLARLHVAQPFLVPDHVPVLVLERLGRDDAVLGGGAGCGQRGGAQYREAANHAASFRITGWRGRYHCAYASERDKCEVSGLRRAHRRARA